MEKNRLSCCHLLLFCLLPMACLIITMGDGRCANADQGTAYEIGPGDVIHLVIRAGGEEQSQAEVTVSEQGGINVPFVGKIDAAGHTISELEALIFTPLERDFFVNPQVHVQVKEFHSLQFFISGAVAKPGKYELNFHPRVMDLIAQAGGVAADRGNIAYILKKSEGQTSKVEEREPLLESESEPVQIDLVKLLDQGDMSENILLESGDTVYIPLDKALNLTKTKVYVEGEVKSPGVFDYLPGLTALRACIMAGGFAEYAAPNRAKIIRNSENGEEQEIIKIDLEKVKIGKEPDIPLKPGDRIHVPETWL